jgi:hypothetical protein
VPLERLVRVATATGWAPYVITYERLSSYASLGSSTTTGICRSVRRW